ncbi:MAG: hypothetical protein V2B18_10895 [Pseudomonadota bacterium]
MIAKFTRKDFLEALFSDYYKQHKGFILVKSVKRGDPRTSTRYFPNIDILAREHYGEDRDVYFGICPRERMRSEREHIKYVPALWADLDIGAEGHEEKRVFFEGPQQAAKAIRSFPRAPSIILESGRGAHLYWLLKQVTEVSDAERIEEILKKISEHLNCDTDCSLDTVLRLPETLNTKVTGKPVNCDVKFINTNFRYSLQDFENLAQAVVLPPPTPKPKPQHAAPSPAPPAPKVTSPIPPDEGEMDGEHQEVEATRGDGIDDMMIVDETIIDDLIDDMSMTASQVMEAPMARSEDGVISNRQPGLYAQELIHGEYAVAAPIAARSAFIDSLSTSGKEVEITLVGATSTINGTVVWSESGLVGVESAGFTYAVPLSSILFIKAPTT